MARLNLNEAVKFFTENGYDATCEGSSWTFTNREVVKHFENGRQVVKFVRGELNGMANKEYEELEKLDKKADSLIRKHNSLGTIEEKRENIKEIRATIEKMHNV